MTPKRFPGVNVVFGAGQIEYQDLPVMRLPDGDCISCWQLTPEELETINRTGCFYLQQSTFNQGFNPILPMVELGDNLGLNNG